MNTCPYCLPAIRRTHIGQHVEYAAELLVWPIQRLVEALTRNVYGSRLRVPFTLAGHAFVRIAARLHIVRFEYTYDETRIHNRSLIFLHEAKRRGLDVAVLTVFGRYLNEYRLRHHGTTLYYHGIPLKIDDTPAVDIDDKYAVKQLLKRHGAPVPEGCKCITKRRARAAGTRIGFPLVVKPNGGSLSYHAVLDIRTPEELNNAIDIAKQYRPDMIVERFLRGKLFRATVVGKQLVFVCEKQRASIEGNGTSTIRELIEQKNADPARGTTNQKNTTLHRIPIDDGLLLCLTQQQYTLDSIPQQGRRVRLQEKYVLSHGCDVVGVTNLAHPETITLCKRISAILNTNLVGIDIICEDITKPIDTQEYGILETNSLPYIDMHQFPSSGDADPVAAKTWDFILKLL